MFKMMKVNGHIKNSGIKIKASGTNKGTAYFSDEKDIEIELLSKLFRDFLIGE